MADDKRTPQEAKRVMDETLRRMLTMPPDPQVKKTKPARKKKRAK